MKQILVTGGAGFIGSNFIEYILAKYPDYKIINLDKLTYAGNKKNFMHVDEKRHEFVHGDICDKSLVFNIMKDCSFVVHFAAESHVDRSINHSEDFINTNVLGTHVLLEAARELGHLEKFIHISTDEVYGSIEQGAFVETDNLAPSSPYSASKAGSDLLAHAYFTTYGLPVIITRSSNNFGPRQYPEKVIPLFITNALADKNLPVYGTGENRRDWIFVEDNCAGVDVVLHNGKIGEFYNIGGGNDVSNIDLTRRILKILGKSEDLITFVDDRLGHDFRYSLNCDKLKKLGFAPKYSFEEGLEKTVNWYLDNKNHWSL